MKPKSERSLELQEILLERGYDPGFCDIVAQNLNTDFTANRMIGYLSYHRHLPPEEIADEMLAILSDRERIMQKKELENANAKWNQFLWEGFGEEETE